MSDPVVHFRNSGVLEIVDGPNHHYLRREAIQTVVQTSYRIAIYVVGRVEPLYLNFVDKKLIAHVISDIIGSLSEDGVSNLDAAKGLMEKIEAAQKELAGSFTQVASKLEEFKNDIHGELSKSIDDLSERVSSLEGCDIEEEEEEPKDVVPVVELNPCTELLMFMFLLAFITVAIRVLMLTLRVTAA
jgi:hypothetical protein